MDEKEQRMEEIESESKAQLYFDEIEELEPIDLEEQKELFERLLDGEQSMVSRLMECNLKRVVSIAKEYTEDSMLLDDLIQEGNVGLFTALQTLEDVDETTQYESYLDEKIREAILSALDDEYDETSKEETIVAKVTMLEEAKKNLAEDLMREPTNEELAQTTGLDIEEVMDILSLSKDVLR